MESRRTRTTAPTARHRKQAACTHTFAYSRLGDRLRQAVKRIPTTYTLDLAGGLTEVL